MGVGYQSIAVALDLSRDKVRYYCKTQGLDGYAKDISKPKPEKLFREQCKNCGKQINQMPIKGRPKTYCSTECKKSWEAKHTKSYEHVCYYCGKNFESRVKKAEFCSHKCYIRDRFWRDEDIETVIQHLRKRTLVPNAPGWIKDLISGQECKQVVEKLK